MKQKIEAGDKLTYNRRWLSVILFLAVISVSALTITAPQPARSATQFLMVNLTVKSPLINESRGVFSTEVTAVVSTNDGKPINGKLTYFWLKTPGDATVSPSLITKDEKDADFTKCTVTFAAPMIPNGQPQRIYTIRCEVTNTPNMYFMGWDAKNITVLPVPEFPTPAAMLFIVAMAAAVLTRKKTLPIAA